MREIDGTVTISLEVFEALRGYEQKFNELQKDVKDLVSEINTEQYDKELDKIDAMKNISDKEINRLVEKAQETLEIIISEKTTRRLVTKYIDKEKGDAYWDIGRMTEREIGKIPLFFDGRQQNKTVNMEKGKEK